MTDQDMKVAKAHAVGDRANVYLNWPALILQESIGISKSRLLGYATSTLGVPTGKR